MRFKPPPADSDIGALLCLAAESMWFFPVLTPVQYISLCPFPGWRVEFRPCEIQFTDFENAAYTIFVVLMTRMMLSFNLNLYMPLSKVDENVATAQERDACRKGVFWFRRLLTGAYGAGQGRTPWSVFCPGISFLFFLCCTLVAIGVLIARMHPHLPSPSSLSRPADCLPAGSPAVRVPQDASEMIPMSINDIINGKQDVFPGLLPLIEVYLKGMNLEFETR